METKNKTVGIAIAMAVAIILGVVLISIIADSTVTKTQLTSVVNERVNVNTAKVGTPNITDESQIFSVTNTERAYGDCPFTLVSMTNDSGSALTETTDWVMNKDIGTFYLKNSSAIWEGFSGTGNYTKVSYTYCPKEYINISWGRTILNLVPGFFALGILGIGVAVTYGSLRDAGVV